MINEYITLYGKRLYGLCVKLCGNTVDADDLYQETWLKAYGKLTQYDAARSFEGWITGICVNAYRDLLRKQKRSPVYGVTVILHYFHGLDEAKTAAALKIPVGTVKSRLHQAKKKLRKELADEPDLQF